MSAETIHSDFANHEAPDSMAIIPAQRQPGDPFGLAVTEATLPNANRTVDHVRGSCYIYQNEVVLEDGSEYSTKLYWPENPIHEVVATGTTPWFTDDGYLRHVAERLAHKGVPTLTLSPERRSLTRQAKLLGRVTLSHDAKAYHSILDSYDQLGLFRAGIAMNFGYSRGAMVGFGIQKYAGLYARLFPYNDYVDPCIHHRPTTKEIGVRKLGAYAISELAELGNGLYNHHDHERTFLRGAVSADPRFWVHQAATGPALFSGQAGRMAETMPIHTSAHVTFFQDSRFNQLPSWQKTLQRYPNIQLDIRDGYHLSGSDPEIVHGQIGRIIIAQRLLQANGPQPIVLPSSVLAARHLHAAH